MILAATDKLKLDLGRSWVIGDAPRDIEAGRAAGCRTILYKNPALPPSPAAQEESKVQPDFVASSLAEAMEIKKAEEMQWLIEDKNTLLLCRTQKKPPRRLRAKP